MIKIGLGLLSVFFIAVPALAQQISIGTMPRHMLLFNPKVQTELKLTEAQKKAISAAGGEAISVDANGRMSMRVGPGTNVDAIRIKFMKSINSAQDKRLTEVWIQKEGLMALNDPDVAKAVGLTDDQRKRVSTIMQEYGENVREIAMSSGGRVNLQDVKPIRESASRKLEGVLHRSQKSKFEGLKGRPFKWP